MSSADLHRRAKEIVLAALELGPEARARLVEDACDDDAELRSEVESLLASDDPADDFFERSPLAAPPAGDAAAREETPLFPAGGLVAGRFEIGARLGAGGMAEVYEARDATLGERVALKAMRPALRASREERERFRREVQLARRVTHPNVCRIFDVFVHAAAPEGADAEAGDVAVIAMELLAGETLAARLKRDGALPLDEVDSIAAQLAAGLGAAHRAGVLHRDFKSANVMLEPGAAGPRAVITDFGIARALDDGDERTLTASGAVLGTPAYMAPEQLLGQPLSPATDVYALGVVLYELLTGRRPFATETAPLPISTAARRLVEEPERLERFRRDAPKRLRVVVRRCLERDPLDRYPSAREVGAALAGEAVSSPQGRAARRRRLRLGAAALAIVALAAATTWRVRAAPSDAPAGDSNRRKTIAIATLDAPAGDLSRRWWSTVLAEAIAAQLDAGGELKVVPPARGTELERQLAPPGAEDENAALVRFARAAGADLVVRGSVAPIAGGSARLDLEIRDATGERRASFTEVGAEDDLAALGERAAARLRAHLGLSGLDDAARSAALARLPTNSAAARDYAEGLAALRALDAPRARSALEAAVAAEPNFAPARLALADAWQALGYETRAAAAAASAYELRAPLPRADQLEIEARYRGARREYDKAADLYRALWTVFPDRLDFGLALGRAELAAGDGQGALATAAAMRRLPPPDGVDPRIDLVAADASWAVGDWNAYFAAARRALEQARTLGLRGVEAEARCAEGWALRYLGKLPEAAEAGEACRRGWSELGQPNGEADALNFLATVALDRGATDEAAATYRTAIERYRSSGSLGGVAIASSNLGNALSDAGDLNQAEALYLQALDLFGEIGRPDGAGMMQNALGNVALARGEIAPALVRYRDALTASRSIDDRRLTALALANLGEAELAGGTLDPAREHLDQALALCRELDFQRMVTQSIFLQGELAAARGDEPGARKRHEEALALRREGGEEGKVESSRLALARLDLESGKVDAAERQAREIAEAFEGQGARAASGDALALVARSELARGAAKQAVATARRALDALGSSGATAARLDAELVLGEAEAGAGDAAAAAQRLASARDQARRLGLVPLELETGCALARAGGSPGSALAELAASAERRGLGAIARRCQGTAAASASGPSG